MAALGGAALRPGLAAPLAPHEEAGATISLQQAGATTSLQQAGATTSPQQAGATTSAQQVTVQGVFEVLWGDGAPGTGSSRLEYRLADAAGNSYALRIDEATLTSAGGLLALDRRQVLVTGMLQPGSTTLPLQPGRGVLEVDSLQRSDVTQLPEISAVTGSVPWVSILCKFNDVAAEPRPLSYVEGLMGTAYPGLDDYWRETSDNQINIVGSVALGWLTLPQPRSYYVYDNGGGVVFDHDRATTDCTAVADAVIYFPSFSGIQMLFNDELDGYAWGGSRFLNLDGVSKLYSTTWYPPWGYDNQSPIAHEMGHGLGLPHSSGPYSATYDSKWDVMSNAWVCGVNRDPTYGCLGQHTIGYHKDRLGWIPASRKTVVDPGEAATVDLARHATPPPSGYLLVEVPISGTTSYYTVERREQAGADAALPGDAVIIHEIVPGRSRPANVVDPDNNGNPNDAAAMWTPGETFVDAANGITVSVGAGLQVSVSNMASPAAYVLDANGGLHHGGAAAPLSPPTPYFGFDIARDIELAATGFYVLDGLGGVHAGGGAPAMSPATAYFGFDVARDMELATTGFYVLDAFGGIHAGGGASVPAPATPYFGFDVARDMELATTGFYVLDAFGGVHAGGGASAPAPSTPYFGFDIARDLELATTGFYVLDGFGGIHAGGGAAPMSPTTPYFGFDAAVDLEMAPVGFYVLDAFGGVHAGGGASALTPASPYFGSNFVRDLELQ